MGVANSTGINPDVEDNTDRVKFSVGIGNHNKTSISFDYVKLAKVLPFYLFGMWMIKKIKK